MRPWSEGVLGRIGRVAAAMLAAAALAGGAPAGAQTERVFVDRFGDLGVRSTPNILTHTVVFQDDGRVEFGPWDIAGRPAPSMETVWYLDIDAEVATGSAFADIGADLIVIYRRTPLGEMWLVQRSAGGMLTPISIPSFRSGRFRGGAAPSWSALTDELGMVPGRNTRMVLSTRGSTADADIAPDGGSYVLAPPDGLLGPPFLPPAAPTFTGNRCRLSPQAERPESTWWGLQLTSPASGRQVRLGEGTPLTRAAAASAGMPFLGGAAVACFARMGDRYGNLIVRTRVFARVPPERAERPRLLGALRVTSAGYEWRRLSITASPANPGVKLQVVPRVFCAPQDAPCLRPYARFKQRGNRFDLTRTFERRLLLPGSQINFQFYGPGYVPFQWVFRLPQLPEPGEYRVLPTKLPGRLAIIVRVLPTR